MGIQWVYWILPMMFLLLVWATWPQWRAYVSDGWLNHQSDVSDVGFPSNWGVDGIDFFPRENIYGFGSNLGIKHKTHIIKEFCDCAIFLPTTPKNSVQKSARPQVCRLQGERWWTAPLEAWWLQRIARIRDLPALIDLGTPKSRPL